MATFTIYGDLNFDTCVAPSSNATLDIYNINGARLTVDTDTRYCPTRDGSVSAGGTGSVDTVTISPSLGGELYIDGTSVKVIPYKSGSGTPNVQSAALAITAATWTSSVVTITTATHSLTTGDYVAIGGMEPNAYNGVFQVTVTAATTFTYELATDPGISTITNGKCVKYWFVRQPRATATNITGGSWAANVTTVTANGHGLVTNDYVLIAGATPAAYNGFWKVTGYATNTFTFTQYASPGNWSSGGTTTKTAQGFFLGFWSAFNVAANPQGKTSAAAISATGFLKVKGVLGGPFVAGNTITIQATSPPTVIATAPEDTGWIEVIGQTTGIITTPRLGKTTMVGSWFYPKLVPIVTTGTTWSANVVTLTFAAAHNITIGSIIIVSGATVSPSINGTWTVASVPLTTTLTYALTGSGSADGVVNVTAQVCTSGVANQTVQLPASTVLTPYAGVWIETGVGTNLYEFYPSAGTLVAASSIATDAARGKVCWVSSQGLLRIGSDGTNTNGYLPAAGCKIRVPNINLVNATRATSPGVGPNVANTTTMTARTTWVSTGGNTGVVNLNTVNSNWYCNFQQTSSLTMAYVGILEGMSMSEISSAYSLTEVGVGNSAALSIQALAQSLCFAGGTETNCTWTRSSAAGGTYVNTRTDVFNIAISNEKIFTFVLRVTATHANENLTRCSNLTYTGLKNIGSRILLTSCSDITFNTTSYADTIATTTGTAAGVYCFEIATKCNNIKIDGIDFFGLTNVQPYNGFVLATVNSSNIKLRNIGSAASPLTLGSVNNAAYIIASAAGAGCSAVEIKRVYTSNTRTGIHNFDNSLSGVVFEDVWGDVADTMTAASLNMQIKGTRATQITTGQTAVYGHHFQDFWPSTTTGQIVLAMNEKTTVEPSNSTVTITQLALPSGFNSAGVIQMPLVNDEVTWETPYYVIGHTGFTVAVPTIISPTALTVTAGSWTTNYTSLTCGTHGLTAGDTVVITGASPVAYNGVFVITNIVSATVIRYYQASNPGTWSSGGNILQLDNIDMFYYLNQGAGYGTKQNLKYNRTGGATTSGNGILTMTDTTGINIGDYVTSKVAGAGASTRVTSIDTGTQVTVNVNSSATTATNVFYFNHLPFETVTDASIGFKLKINLKTWANCNTAAVTNIAIPTVSTTTGQAYQYPLDTITLTLMGLQTGSDVVVLSAGTTTEIVNIDSNPGSTYNFIYSTLGNVDIGLFKAGYIPFYIRNYLLTSSNVALPCVQVVDRAYS